MTYVIFYHDAAAYSLRNPFAANRRAQCPRRHRSKANYIFQMFHLCVYRYILFCIGICCPESKSEIDTHMKKHKCANLTHKTQISRYCGWKVRAYFNHNRYWGMEKLLHPTKIVDVIIYLFPGHRPAFSLKWVPGFEIFRTHTERVNLVHYALAWGILFSISYRDVRPFHYVKGSSQGSQVSDKAACYSR